MAIFHLSVKTISRSAGRSATAAAAYRAGARITDERTGEIHDYTRKGGVESAELVLPASAPRWAADRAAVWNAAEQAETRKNSTVAREFEIALPEELSPAERQRLARDFAREIVEQHGCAADVAIHAPGKKGDNRNHHAHILLSTRRLGPEGFAAKTRELDDQKIGPQIVTQWRERFASLQNERLREAGIKARVDHRTLEAQEIDREPTRHLGPAAAGYERRTGEPSRKQQDFEDWLTWAKEAGELERQGRQIDRDILDLSGELEAAKRERDRQAAVAGMANFRATFEAQKQKLAELGKQQAREAFERQKVEQERQKQAEQARQAQADQMERQRQEREREARKQKRGSGPMRGPRPPRPW